MTCEQHRFYSKVGTKTPMLGFSQVCSHAASLCTTYAALCVALPGIALTLLTTTHCSYLGRATTSVEQVKMNSRIMLGPLSPLDKHALYMSSFQHINLIVTLSAKCRISSCLETPVYLWPA